MASKEVELRIRQEIMVTTKRDIQMHQGTITKHNKINIKQGKFRIMVKIPIYSLIQTAMATTRVDIRMHLHPIIKHNKTNIKQVNLSIITKISTNTPSQMQTPMAAITKVDMRQYLITKHNKTNINLHKCAMVAFKTSIIKNARVIMAKINKKDKRNMKILIRQKKTTDINSLKMLNAYNQLFGQDLKVKESQTHKSNRIKLPIKFNVT